MIEKSLEEMISEMNAKRTRDQSLLQSEHTNSSTSNIRLTLPQS